MSNTIKRFVPYVLPVAFLIAVVALNQSPLLVHAQDTSSGTVNGNDLNALQVPLVKGLTVPGIILFAINLFLLVAGILALLYAIYGGFLYITAGGDTAKAATGRTAIINAVIGVLIIVIAYSIIYYFEKTFIPVGTSGSPTFSF